MSEERQHFSSGIQKVDRDGNVVMSSYLDPGEELFVESGRQETSARQEGEAPTTAPEVTAAKSNDAGPNHPEGSEEGETQTRDFEPVPEVEETDEEREAREAKEAENQHAETDEEREAREAEEQAQKDAEAKEAEERRAEQEKADAESGKSETPADETPADERPKDSDNKDAWFAYAQKHGFEGEKDDLTKAQYIENYGA